MFVASLPIYKKLSKNRSHRIGEKLLSLIDKQNAKILDFGGGNMWLAEFLVDKIAEAEITGIDVIEDQNLEEKIKNHPRIHFQTYQSKDIPFTDNTFDFAIASAVMHHTPNPEYYLSELKRVTKPGGSILLVEEMYLNPIDKFYIMLEDYVLNKLKKGVPVPLQFRPYKHYKAEFEKQGLQVAYEGSLRPGFPWKHHYVFKLTK